LTSVSHIPVQAANKHLAML